MGNIRISKLWPARTIPFDISRPIRENVTLLNNIQEAISQWNRLTVVELRDFPDLVSNPNWIAEVTRRGGNPFKVPRIKFIISPFNIRCSSQVGMTGGIQYIKCFFRWNVNSLTHEIGHALGLWHEQQRIDRDKYVIVSRTTISDAEYRRNYIRKRPPGTMPHGNYDCNSIMHYPLQETKMEVIPRSLCANGIGPRSRDSDGDGIIDTRISIGDIATINFYYGQKPRY